MNSSRRYLVLIVLIAGMGLIVNGWSYLGEAHVDRKPLNDFPQQVGSWYQIGSDQILDEPTLKVLRASDYLIRNFQRNDGQVANFYVGYYATQSNGASYHSPLNCLPGSGWVLSEPGTVALPRPDGSTFIANKFVIKNGNDQSLMVYWYEGRGRSVASEYWGKVYTVIDSVRLRHSDGAMIRITVPIQKSEDLALDSAVDLARVTSPHLPEFVPN